MIIWCAATSQPAGERRRRLNGAHLHGPKWRRSVVCRSFPHRCRLEEQRCARRGVVAVAASRCCKIFRLSSRFRRDARSPPSVQQVASLAGHADDLQAAEWWGGPAAATGSLLVREDSRPSFYSGAAAKDMKGRRKRGRGRRGGEVAVRRGSDRSRRPFDGRCHFSRRLLARVVLLGRLDSRVGRPRPMASRGSCCSPFRPSLRQQAARLRQCSSQVKFAIGGCEWRAVRLPGDHSRPIVYDFPIAHVHRFA